MWTVISFISVFLYSIIGRSLVMGLLIRGDPKRKSIRDSVDKNKVKNRPVAVWQFIFGTIREKSTYQSHKNTAMNAVICEKSTCESCKNTPVNTVILHPAVCVCDVVNKAGMHGRSIHLCHEGNFFQSSLGLGKSEPTWLCLEELQLEARNCFCCRNRIKQP